MNLDRVTSIESKPCNPPPANDANNRESQNDEEKSFPVNDDPFTVSPRRSPFSFALICVMSDAASLGTRVNCMVTAERVVHLSLRLR